MIEVTIEITQFCENDCDYCSSDASSGGQHLDLSNILRFLRTIGKVDRINISGGEPLSHPDFYKIYKYCKSLTDEVWVYTALIDNIIYNANIIREMNVEANVCIVPGREVYIPKNADKVHLLKLIRQGRAEAFPHIEITCSRNFYSEEECKLCNHTVLQADGKTVIGPCKKSYN